MATQLNPIPFAGLTGLVRRLALDGVLSEPDARQAVEDAAKQKIPVATWLVDNGLVEGTRVAQGVSAEFGVPVLDAAALDLLHLPLKMVSEELITKHGALPLFKRGNRLFVGIADPTNSAALDEIKFHSNCAVEPILIEPEQLKRIIEQALTAQSAVITDMGDDDEGLEKLALGEMGEDGSDGSVDTAGTEDAPVVKFVNKILVDAIKRGASDIHFEPYESKYRVRVRLDGILRAVASPPIKLSPRISSRLKVMSGLDIAERRVPQDGRIKLNLSKGKSIDFRVSTLPTLFGEKVVLRILDAAAARMGIDKLGYEEDQKQLFLDAIHKPYGMVLA
nr:Flp pilus assembly complex ATPase component TadA [Pseudomonadota bacterium]